MKKIFVSLVSLLTLAFSANAQFDLSQPAPSDPEFRVGKLDNGLTYYIRHNEEPEQRASFYIIQNVGAVLENDDQNGLAHFLEHMAFNGTENFPGKMIISSLEKHGVAFGYNINAYTSFDETVYNLSDVPVSDPGLLDTCLLILHDWSNYISLEGDEIDAERGVISEEWRTSKTASRRMLFATIPVIYEGTKYAVRDIIGDINVIQNFDHSLIRNFYHDWYRTDLQAIAVVGDIDVDEVEQKIKNMFSEIPAVPNAYPRTYEVVADHSDVRYVLAQDKEAKTSTVELVSIQKAVPREKKNLDYLRDQYIIELINSMANTRVGDLLQQENPPFISGTIMYGSSYARGYNEFSISAYSRQNEDALAFKAVLTEAERIRQHGFTEAELERTKQAVLSNLESRYNEIDKITNDTYAYVALDNFLYGEPMTSAEFDYLYYAGVVMPSISVEEVNARYRELMSDQNRTIVVMGQEGEGMIHLTKEEAMAIINEVSNTPLDPYVEEELASSLIDEELVGSKIVKTEELPQFGAKVWTLENGARVIYKKADYEKDQISVNAYSFGGISTLDDNLVMAAECLPVLSLMYGVSDFDNITLQRMLAGKKVSVDVDLSETVEEIEGTSTPKDFETMMQLIYLRFAKPRFDAMAHNSYMERLMSSYDNLASSPDLIMNDSLSLITTNYSNRTAIFNRETLSTVTLSDVEKIYRDRFNGADEFTFIIVGNVDEETVIPMVEKYIGSIPKANRTETYVDRKIGQPKGKVDKNIELDLAVPKATVYLSYEKDMPVIPYNSLGLSVLSGILDIVYTETVREKEGGTYGVSVSLSTHRTPSQRAEGYIAFECDPNRADELKAIIYDELNKIIKKGPSQENLNKTVLNILKNREESKLHNSYWTSILLIYDRFGIDNNSPKNYEDVLNSFTTKDIKKVAKKMFKKSNVVDLVFSPTN